MNPRGSQYALANTLHGWTRLEQPSTKQARALRWAYRGVNPKVYSRYGNRQWAAPLPATRLIVKDPFALLSLPLVVGLTGATPVILYRHPAAVLSSYRRMGWSADGLEAEALARSRPEGDALLANVDARRRSSSADVLEMALLWSILYAVALNDIVSLPTALIVSHAELAAGGPSALRRLCAHSGLAWSEQIEGALSTRRSFAENPARSGRLHNFQREPAQVASAWREEIAANDVAVLEEITAPWLSRLDDERLRLL